MARRYHAVLDGGAGVLEQRRDIGVLRCWSTSHNSFRRFDDRFFQKYYCIPISGSPVVEACALNTLTDRQLKVLHAAKTREAGGDWTIERMDGLDCIERGWLTEDHYLTDTAKCLLLKNRIRASLRSSFHSLIQQIRCRARTRDHLGGLARWC